MKLPKDSFVQVDNLHTAAKSRLIKYLGSLDPDTLRAVSRKVVLALELEDDFLESERI